MKTLSVREMRAGYEILCKALEEEGEVVLTHHGKPFARVLPIEPPKRPFRSHAELRATMPYQSVGSETLIREDRDGRD